MKRALIAALALLVALNAFAAPKSGLTKKEQEIVAKIDAEMPDALALLEKSVNITSGTQNLPGVRAVGDVYRAELDRIGFKTSWIEMPKEMNRAGHLVGEINGKRGRRVMLVGHLDTVVEGQPFLRNGDIARGNGGADMKGGDVIILAALRALHDSGALRDRRIIVYFTGDEEDPGHPVDESRRDFVAAAKRSNAALAFEASVGDTATVARRGVSMWTLTTTGITGHSAGIFDTESGAGANFELARILNGFYDEVRGEQYLTFNPSVIVGGTDVKFDGDAKSGTAVGKTNVIAQKAFASGDLRFISNEQRDHTKEKMQSIVALHLPQTSAAIEFVDEYPAMSPTPGNYALLGVADRSSQDLGLGPLPALDPGLRGAGDVSFIAPYVDSLDGLGARGSGSHTPEETVDLASFPSLVKRAAILIYRLTR